MPYTAEVLYALHARHLRELWPLAVPLFLLTLAVLVPVMRGATRYGRPVATVVAVVLAAGWLWTGMVFHFHYFATINFAAPAYAGLFVLQAALLLWQGVARRRPTMAFRGDGAGWTGVALLIYGVVGYPLVDYLAAAEGLRLVGLAPGPTTAFTLGLLLQATGRIPLHLLLVPVAWCVVAGASGLPLGIPADVLLLPAALATVVAAPWHNRRIAFPAGRR
ncbi:MAG: DUF6064 family protein [Gammaproteobacteria bacterium]|nr:DUF6064 family protein [Gammaproteobacteria bacterium]